MSYADNIVAGTYGRIFAQLLKDGEVFEIPITTKVEAVLRIGPGGTAISPVVKCKPTAIDAAWHRSLVIVEFSAKESDQITHAGIEACLEVKVYESKPIAWIFEGVGISRSAIAI